MWCFVQRLHFHSMFIVSELMTFCSVSQMCRVSDDMILTTRTWVHGLRHKPGNNGRPGVHGHRHQHPAPGVLLLHILGHHPECNIRWRWRQWWIMITFGPLHSSRARGGGCCNIAALPLSGSPSNPSPGYSARLWKWKCWQFTNWEQLVMVGRNVWVQLTNLGKKC